MSLKIIIVSHEPLTKRTWAVFGIDDFFQKKCLIEYWNVSELLNGVRSLPDQVDCEFQKEITNMTCLTREIRKIKECLNCIFILEFPLVWKNRKIILLLSQSRKVLFQINFYANTSLNMTVEEKLVNAFHEGFLLKTKNKFAYWRFLFFKKTHNISIYYVSSKSDSLLKVNHPDYEAYKKRKCYSEIPGKYMVFIDTFFPYHPDFKYFYGKDFKYLSDSYFASLNSFFQYVENKYSLPVIIAAHPKAEYTNEFGERKIIKGKTLNLICHAETIFIHASNAISYVVLANKPFVFISNDAYSSVSFLNNRLHKLASLFHVKVENVDKNKDVQVNRLGEKDREMYIYTYLTDKHVENSENIDLLISYFKDENKYNCTGI